MRQLHALLMPSRQLRGGLPAHGTRRSNDVGFLRIRHPQAQFSTVVTPALGAGHPVDRVHRSRVPGGTPRFSPTISEVKATDQQRPAQAPRDVAARVVRMAVENPQWGYTRIRGALSNLGHEIARTTVKRILHDHGIDPAPERSRRLPWKTFLQAHGEGLTACDRFTVEGLTLAGLPRDLVFFVIALPSRRVTIAGIHPPPYGAWMEQMARNLTDPVDGCLRRARSLIHDRDPLDTRVFGEILEGGGVQPIRLPPKSPNLNAYAERFVRSIEECLSRVVPLGEGHVRLLVGEDVDHDHRERNHHGLDNQLLPRPPPPVSLAADVQRRERLGGLLNFYHREAA